MCGTADIPDGEFVAIAIRYREGDRDGLHETHSFEFETTDDNNGDQ